MDGKISNFSQLAYIRRYTLNGGKEDGIRVVEVDNGNIRFLLNESKCLDVMQLWHKGVNLSFISKNGFSKREIPFIKRFEGGMLYTVGLDSAGAREGFDLHGSFHNIPANVISTICTEEKIEVVAEMDDSELFGKNLKFIRKISTKLGGDKVIIGDTLINNGTKTEDYCILYHTNLGYPMLDEGITIDYDGEKITPRTPLAKKMFDGAHTFLAPTDNQEERCYFIENKLPLVKVINSILGKEFDLEYSKETLPKMVLWQSNASQDYALGIEPTTTFLDDGFEFCRIEKGESKQFTLSLTVKDC